MLSPSNEIKGLFHPMRTEVRGRIGKLILLLSSNQPGEVVAAASAIGRTLQAEGKTWHDLASTITALPAPANDDETRKKETCEQVFSRALELDLSDWEQSFVKSVRRYWRRNGYITPKQGKVLQDIFDARKPD